jgi:uncharacterized membrane protein
MTNDALLFEAVIVPHRSLSASGLRRLLLAICLMCSASAAVFVWLGAWPVGGFTGVELLLAALLFRLNARAARGSELVLLTEAGLRVIRTTPDGTRRERTLSPSWLSLVIEERPGRVPGLVLVARDVRVEIGRDLGEAEKRDLAEALGGALDRLRNPRFDNPQLRPDAAQIV